MGHKIKNQKSANDGQGPQRLTNHIAHPLKIPQGSGKFSKVAQFLLHIFINYYYN